VVLCTLPAATDAANAGAAAAAADIEGNVTGQELGG
jgi:hypothetical protein